MSSNTTPFNPIGVTSALGRAIRLRRLFGTEGKALVVALDQAVPRGVAPQLARINDTYRSVRAGNPNAITVSKGIGAALLANEPEPLPWILKASSFSVDFHLTFDAMIGSVDDAVRLGADAVAVGISAGSSVQPQMLEMLSATVEKAAGLGMPTVCHAYPSGDLWGDRKGSLESVLYAARAAAELGVDVVKTWYTGSSESFAEVVAGTPALVMVAGGAKADTDLEVLEMAESVMQAGAAGLTFGRNVWGAEDPAKIITALRAIVHDGATAAVASKHLS
ncbi:MULTISPECIES: class I fructose-bisphosphate aldolase [Arthrobacter]|uniref:class I fructose-bisphosphate aldolase n=1 Tax=Arthrobacter TaxID=1663 RepID=UPI00047C34C0|nr:fructose-bisphosphate aldolase [Arthrobacter sp. 35/47]